MKNIIKKIINRAVWLLCRMLPVEKNKIVVSSYYGRGYCDNPKAIVNELIKRNYSGRIIWLTRGHEAADSLPERVEACDYDSLRMIREISTAQIWIDNCRKEARYKKQQQIYVQTWHGFALKRIEKDALSTFPEYYEGFAKRDSSFCNLIVSDSDFMTRIYRQSFWYSGEIKKFGAPRNDIMQEDAQPYRLKVAQTLGLPQDCHTVLYAPTFRADLSLTTYCLDYQRLRSACQKRFGGNWVVLVRLHPNIMKKSADLCLDNISTFDATAYQDMQELLAAVDVVVSDYSSLMFDFALTDRPCFQFATDIEDYKQDRNFYLPLDKLPFPLAVDNDQMEQNILAFEPQAYTVNLHRFINEYGIISDGQASLRCVDWILQQLDTEENPERKKQ